MAALATQHPLVAHKTVLVLLPPREFAHRINPFRRVHDKSALRWTAHITLTFPFVETNFLPETVAGLRDVIKDIQPFKLRLDKVESFSMSGYDSVHLTTARQEDQRDVQRLWKTLADSLGYRGRPFKPHMTLGQAPNRNNLEALQFLNAKAQRVLLSVKELDWTVGSVVVLKKDESDGGIMKYYDEIFLGDHTESAYQTVPPFPTMSLNPNGSWKWNYTGALQRAEFPSAFSIATYNLLHDTEFPFQERAGRVIDTLANADADILCLQEVSDENLAVLLGSARIQSAYLFSSRDSAVTLENERNLMILSRFPFEYSMIDTGSTHKPACIATFNAESRGYPPLVVACIHLTAGRAASPLEQKHKELGSVVDHLKANYPKADWAIVGDLNWPNEIHSTPADDLFDDIGAPGGEPTYDPTRNWLAAKTARESKTGQRYDRIYLKRNGSWVGQDVGTFGVTEKPASDHWGLKSFIRKPNDITHAAKSEGKSYVHPASDGPLPATLISASHLDALLRSEDWLPSLERERQMERALHLLRAILCSTSPALAPAPDPTSSQGKQSPRVIIRLEAVGSYALGMHSMSSDIDCLAVGNISPKTFWMLARSKIRAHLLKAQAEGMTETVKLKRFVKDAVVQMMELEVCSIKVDLQYCAAAGLAEHWDEIAELPSDSPYFSLSHSSLVTLNAYRDLLTLKKVIPSLDQFRLAHRSLKLFLTLRGLWGARFGYLGGFHLTLLLTHVALSLPKNAQATHLIESFLKTYAEWDWSKDIVYPIPSRAPEATSTSTYRRLLSKEPMVVLSIQRPLSNLTSHASRNSVETLSQGFQQAYSALTQSKSWFNICGARIQDEITMKGALKEFVDGHRRFIKLNVHFWGGNDMKGRALIGWLESRIVNLLVQVHQNVPDILVRFWPERLVDQSAIDPVARDPNGFYLFGLSALPNSDNVARSGDHIAKRNSDAQSALSSCLRTFEHGLRSNERFYDEAETFISLVDLKQGQIPSKIVPDPFKWQDDGFDAPLEDEEDEVEGPPEPSAMDDGAGSANDSWDDFRAPSSAQRKREAAAGKSKSTPHIRAGKLRTSSDVYNRLIWDSTGAVSKTDYCIGYEDRFKGIKETPLTAWKREVEDESFIPFHRVVYFKRLQDGQFVWDRRTKVDLVFGSGVSAT